MAGSIDEERVARELAAKLHLHIAETWTSERQNADTVLSEISSGSKEFQGNSCSNEPKGTEQGNAEETEGDRDDGLLHAVSSSGEASGSTIKLQISEDYIRSLAMEDLAPGGGVRKHVLSEASGSWKPVQGDTVKVHYSGFISDGACFCSSEDFLEPYRYSLGSKVSVVGWEMSLASMRKGETALFVCTPEYAYGATGYEPAIPGNATIVFVIRMIDFHGEDITEAKNGQILKSVVKPKTGKKIIHERARVHVRVTGFHGDDEFENVEIEFVLGEGQLAGLPEGLEMAIKSMGKHEISRFVIAHQHAFGAEGNSKFKIPPFAWVHYEVEVLKFKNVKQVWELNIKQKLCECSKIKDRGNSLFKEGHYKVAKYYYQTIVNFLLSEQMLEGEEGKQRKAYLLAGYLNLAMCGLKLNDNLDVLFACEKALEIDPRNEKALFRQGLSNMNIMSFEKAVLDFKKVLKVAPDNKAAAQKLNEAKSKSKQGGLFQKETFGGIFDEYAKKNSSQKDCDIFDTIEMWDNQLAKDFLPLDKEMEAFGEKMPEAKYTKQNKENSNPDEQYEDFDI